MSRGLPDPGTNGVHEPRPSVRTSRRSQPLWDQLVQAAVGILRAMGGEPAWPLVVSVTDAHGVTVSVQAPATREVLAPQLPASLSALERAVVGVTTAEPQTAKK